MVVLGDKDCQARPVSRVRQTPVHLKFFGNGRKALAKFREAEIKLHWIEFDASQEEIRFFISMLVGEQDVAVVAKDEISNAGNHAFAVGTGDEKYGGVMHRSPVSSVYPCVLYGSNILKLEPQRTQGTQRK